MCKKFWVWAIAVCALGQPLSAQENDDRKHGWYWYETAPEVAIEPESEEPAAAVAEQSPLEALKAQGEGWENAAAQAILNPTVENLEDYLRQTQQVTTQAAKFAQIGQQLIWTDPEFAYAGRGRPTTVQEQLAYAEVQDSEQNQALETIAQSKGLVYYFTSTCPYCKRFTPLLKQLAERNGITVIPVSLDGKGVPEFPYPKRDYQLGQKLEVNGVPAVFMVDPDNNAVAKVSYGFTSQTGLVKRLISALKRMEKES